jgi:hypothetical protein
MRMRAAVLEEFGKPLNVQEIELADPRPGEVLVRLVACGVCHTDLYTASGADPSGYARAYSATRAPGSWSASARACATSRSATTWSRSSRPSAASASTAAARARTSAWPSASSRTRATCPTARRG